MKIISNCEEKVEGGSVLTFGNFDGIHLGHELAISTVKEISKKRGLPSLILTFEPHPSMVLFGKSNFRLINQEQKMKLISDYGIDYLCIIHFNEQFSQISYSDFITEILIGKYSAKHIVVGKSCSFGYKRLGNTLILRKYSKIYGYSLTELEPLVIDREVCSSLIRKFLKNGKTNAANKLLGKPYQVSGIVIKGEFRGRVIGFPTINIQIEDCMIKPRFGTYCARAAFFNNSNSSNWLYGVVNVGMRPTFKDLKKPIVEMHILDFNEDVYGRNVDIQLLKFIRSEKTFSSVDELTKQINCDIVKAHRLREIL